MVLEVLVHIGLDTVSLEGKPFEVKVLRRSKQWLLEHSCLNPDLGDPMQLVVKLQLIVVFTNADAIKSVGVRHTGKLAANAPVATVNYKKTSAKKMSWCTRPLAISWFLGRNQGEILTLNSHSWMEENAQQNLKPSRNNFEAQYDVICFKRSVKKWPHQKQSASVVLSSFALPSSVAIHRITLFAYW